ncbi:MAG: hypothetical protein IKG46_12525 [Solobacterium sp.]|nr:hypothetical protein [Solobacterium sp.]
MMRGSWWKTFDPEIPRRAEQYIDHFVRQLQEDIRVYLQKDDVFGAFAAFRSAFSVMEEADLHEEELQEERDHALTECLMKILGRASGSETEMIRIWVCALHEEIDTVACREVIEYVYEHGFNDPGHLRRLYEEIHVLLDDPSRIHTVSADDLYLYRDILMRMGSDTEEYEAWLESHGELDAVCAARLRDAEEKEEWDAVYFLMKLEYNRCDPGRKDRYVYRLYDLCRKRNDQEGMKYWLSLYVQQKADPSETDVLVLRSLCTPAEWAQIRTNLLERCVYLRAAICFEDGMYAQLLETLRQCRISVTDRYASALREICPAELAELYADHLRKLQDRYPNKALYEEMRKYLKILAGIPGGQKKAEEFMMDWLTRYPKRRAMQEMIREVNIQIHGNVVYMANI